MDRVGEINYNTFGNKMEIIKYKFASNLTVYFQDYNYTIKTTYANFKRGAVKCPYDKRNYGIGYLGEGEYSATINGIITNSYSSWLKMFERCYSKKFLKRKETYKDCKVCEEWHNYQNFAKWYEDNYYEIDNQRMCLDKDILCKGNKVYSPEVCVFVPNDINTLFVKSDKIRGELPIGVQHTKSKNKFVSSIKLYGKVTYLGTYTTETKAFNVYKESKERHIKEVADKYKYLIPENLYNAMYKYKVEITD